MIKGKPDVSRFLDGGAASEVPTQQRASKLLAMQGVPKRQKLVELPEPVFMALKDRAYADYKKNGRRVTETEIIIAALTRYLGLT